MKWLYRVSQVSPSEQNRYFCIKGVKEAFLARGPKGRGTIRHQRAKIAVHARNADIIFCKII
jgi:hypothetical protein